MARRGAGVLFAGGLAAIMGAGLAAPAAAADRVAVVASFSVLGDLVARVGGDRVDVGVLVGPGGDVHAHVPTPADLRRIGAARLVVVNGLGFEGALDRLAAPAGTAVVVASRGVAPRRPASDLGGDLGGGEAGVDPHAWQSVAAAAVYVTNIRDGLIAVDPAGRTVYEANAAGLAAELTDLDADIRRILAAIPERRRKVITTHDAFGYFGRDYGIAFVAAQGVSSETEPSARDIAAIIVTIRREHIPALFFESAVDPRLIRRIAADTGARIGGTLFGDTLAAQGPASSYPGMMRHNAVTLARALGDGSAP